MFKELEREIQKINSDIKRIKSFFESQIRDRSISLDSRWALFCFAPDYFSEKSDKLPEFSCQDSEIINKIGKITFVGDVNTVDIVNLISESTDCIRLTNSVKERFLECNIKSVNFDPSYTLWV